MKTLIKIFILAIVVVSFNCKQTTDQSANETTLKEAEAIAPASSSEQSQAVLEHHLKSFGENNLAELIADYTAESIVVTPDSTYVGLEQIENFFTGLLPAFPTEGTTINLDKMVVENDLAYIIWNGDSPSISVPFGTDTFIIVDGKIKKQTFAGVINPK